MVLSGVAGLGYAEDRLIIEYRRAGVARWTFRGSESAKKDKIRREGLNLAFPSVGVDISRFV